MAVYSKQIHIICKFNQTINSDLAEFLTYSSTTPMCQFRFWNKPYAFPFSIEHHMCDLW